MARQPTVSTDSVAQDQIRAFVERILRMKEEAKAINDDIREIYAEAKGNGFDKTVLGKLVNYVEKRTKDSAAVAEADAIFDLYLEAYDGTPSRTHAHEGTIPRESNQGKTDTAGRHSAQLDGVVSRTSGGVDTPATITEPADTAPAVVAAADGEGDPGPDALPVDTNSDTTPPVSDDDGSNPAIMGEADPSVSPDSIQPETANEAPSVRDDDNEGGEDEAAVEHYAGINSTQQTGAGEGETSSAPGSSSNLQNLQIAPSNVTQFIPKPHTGKTTSDGKMSRHDLCLNVDVCAGTWREACHRCRSAAAAQIPVVSGGVEIRHEGRIGQ